MKSLKAFRIYVLHSNIISYVPFALVKQILIQPDIDGKRSVITEISSAHGDKNSHQQNSNEVTHGTELISQHSIRAKTIQSNQKLKGALHRLDARAPAWDKNVLCVHARPTRNYPHKKPRIC
jgi:hypothetical protein